MYILLQPNTPFARSRLDRAWYNRGASRRCSRASLHKLYSRYLSAAQARLRCNLESWIGERTCGQPHTQYPREYIADKAECIRRQSRNSAAQYVGGFMEYEMCNGGGRCVLMSVSSMAKRCCIAFNLHLNIVVAT